MTEQDPANVPQDANHHPDLFRGTYQHQQRSALVPEHIGPGVFSTGAIILTTANEFVIDFLIRMARPHQIVARVILPPAVVPQIVAALQQSSQHWQQRFGKMPTLQSPPPGRRPPLDEVYDELKLPDSVLSGAYANGVMISFSASEFLFDFITGFFPRSAVSQRVYMSVPQIPRFAEALSQTLSDYQNKMSSDAGASGGAAGSGSSGDSGGSRDHETSQDHALPDPPDQDTTNPPPSPEE